MPRILVALDDSCGSEKALEAAVKLAQQDGGRLTAVTVLEQTGNPAPGSTHGGCQGPERGARLEELLQTAANYARSRGVRLTPILREGHPADDDHPLRRGRKGHTAGPWGQQPVQRRPSALAAPPIR